MLQDELNYNKGYITMRLIPISHNMTELTFSDKSVLFSYKTPVAGHDQTGPFRTDQQYSKTTTKHINKYLGHGIGRIVPQSYIEEITA